MNTNVFPKDIPESGRNLNLKNFYNTDIELILMFPPFPVLGHNTRPSIVSSYSEDDTNGE